MKKIQISILNQTLETILKEDSVSFSKKRYIHFDNRVDFKSQWKYIKNTENIEKHTFYPLLHYVQKTKKYKVIGIDDKGHKIKDCKLKERDIFYASHRDRAIYQYYSYIINYYYNEYMKEKSINHVAIAYRNNYKKNQGSNIFFAKKAINMIRKQDSYIIVGDFKSFFDTLNHGYLKKSLMNVLNLDSIPKDFYKVYKSVTRYVYCDLEKIKDIIEIEKNINKNDLSNESRLCSAEEFRQWKKKYKNNYFIRKNLNNIGIPQGTSISATLSNVYMMNFDENVYNKVKESQGAYFRYSDDFIIVLPKRYFDLKKLKQFYDFIKSEVKYIFLNLEESKTQIYEFQNEKINNITKDILSKNKINDERLNYLGFSFDGKYIKIRDRSISKYYCRLYKKIKNLNKQKKKGKKDQLKKFICYIQKLE